MHSSSAPAYAPPRSVPAPPSIFRGAPEEDAEAALRSVHARGDRWMRVFVAFHLAVAALLAPVHAAWGATAVSALALAVPFYLAVWLRPGTFLTRAVAGVSLQGFCVLHIYQMQGLAEMHFWFFTAVGMMLVYQDWRALWPGVVAIIGQHTLFALWHNQDVHPGGVHFFEPDRVGVLKMTFHYGIALVHVGVASYWAHTLRSRTLADAAAHRQLREQHTALETAHARLQEQAAELEAQSAELQAQAAELEAILDRSERAGAERAALLAEAVGARAEAEAANAARSRFLATMSHELRTPLNAIGGYADLLLMGIQGPVAAGQRDFLDRIQRAQRHLLGLINDVLDFGRIEAGHVEVHTAEFGVEELLAEVEPLVQPQAEARQVAYTRGGGPPARLRADRDRARQVMVKLLANAVKFTPQGGRVWVDWNVAEGRVHLHVRDTGQGVAPEMIGRIFEPFVQAEDDLTRTAPGTGLGLAISRELARSMDGDVRAESEPGRGSTFTLVLPAAAAPDDAEGEPGPP